MSILIVYGDNIYESPIFERKETGLGKESMRFCYSIIPI